MGVFLRWGVFGILSVAGLLYAYNASKRMAEHRPPRPAPVVSEALAVADDDPDEESEAVQENVADQAAWPPLCAEELQVAERALKMRRDGEPLDRLLRIDRIIFQPEEERRERLARVARAWFEREGRDPDADTLSADVLRDCERATASSAP